MEMVTEKLSGCTLEMESSMKIDDWMVQKSILLLSDRSKARSALVVNSAT